MQALEKAFERKRLESDAQHRLEEDEQYQSEVSAQMASIVQAASANSQEEKLSEREKQNELVRIPFTDVILILYFKYTFAILL